MSGNTFGRIFRVTTFGESHGEAVGCVVDGCPAGLAIDTEIIRKELERRRPGMGGASTTRAETDESEILSGIFEGRTLGTPIAIIIRNKNQKSADYDALKDIYRPGHADRVWEQKFGVRDHRGGGRASGRETAARVAAGAVAKAFLAANGLQINGWTAAIAGIAAPKPHEADFDLAEAELNPLRLPCKNDNAAYIAIEKNIAELRDTGDSAGGIVSCVATGLPAGLGEPVFDKLDALLGAAIFSIGAVKGVEIGAGFAAAASKGSQNNDSPLPNGYASNNSGGVLGGISTGQQLEFNAYFKPVPSIALKQKTINRTGNECEIEISGRHDICVCPRAVPVVEAMTAIVLADLWVMSKE